MKVQPGDVVVVRSGERGFLKAHPNFVFRVDPHPGLHLSCLEWFREKDIAAISWDMMDERPSGYAGFGMSAHLAIPFLGLALVDNTYPERLAKVCARGGAERVPLHRHAAAAPGEHGRARASHRHLLRRPSMDRSKSVVTPERFKSGRTFEQYLAYIGTPENLAREGTGGGSKRPDHSAVMREWYEGSRLTDTQTAAWKWLAAQPGGPAKILVLSEDWSSDCRRDVPMLARVAEAAGIELRIFDRDGQNSARAADPMAEPGRGKNADIMAEFMNEKNGGRFQSIPGRRVLRQGPALPLPLHRSCRRIYHKDRVVDGEDPRPAPRRERRRRRRSARRVSSAPSRRRPSSGCGRERGSTRWRVHCTNAWSWGADDARERSVPEGAARCGGSCSATPTSIE